LTKIRDIGFEVFLRFEITGSQVESVGNKSIWVMNAVSESFTNDMKAQAIAAKQYRLVPGQFIILAFLAPSTLLLGRDFSRFDSPLYEV